MHDRRPIGLFDSGLGGVTVLRRIRALLPGEHLLYVADTANLPYGDKSRSFVERRSHAITRFLVDAGAKAIVVACNTATAAAIDSLRRVHSLPIVGIEPAVKPAANGTRSGVVGILATATTLQSARYAELLERYGGYVRVINQACPGLVELIESGDLQSPELRSMLARYIEPLLAQGVDHVVLGCTHYPLVVDLIREIAGDRIRIIDPGDAVARRLADLLEHHELTAGSGAQTPVCYISGNSAHAATLAGLLAEIEIHPLPDLPDALD